MRNGEGEALIELFGFKKSEPVGEDAAALGSWPIMEGTGGGRMVLMWGEIGDDDEAPPTPPPAPDSGPIDICLELGPAIGRPVEACSKGSELCRTGVAVPGCKELAEPKPLIFC